MTRFDQNGLRLRRTALALLAGGSLAVQAWAGEPPVLKSASDERPARLASFQDKSKPANETVKSERTDIKTTEHKVESTDDYKEVSDFFNIREANPSVTAGETELEFEFGWETGVADDNFAVATSLKYGFTDDFFGEIELLPITIGDGGDQGAGDIALILFYRWWRESEGMPAFATWVEGRIPSGDGSSGVDGELHLNLTKTWSPGFRGHLEGYLKTANGARGGEEEDNRRSFQWGIGPGIDFDLSENTIGIINYLNEASEEYGSSNAQTIEVGVATQIAENQHLKLAADFNLDGDDDSDNFGAKIQWSIEW